MEKEDMNIVIVGHVDHGKSTLIGRLLADTGTLPQGRLEQVRETCRRNSKPFEYAFLLDALKDEQAQGITIDTARCFFKSKKRDYIILDAPGHIEFLKNMITGAARAEAAILLIDANEGVRENSRRHGYMLSMLGVKKVVVAVNKLDLKNYSREVFEEIQREYGEFLNKLAVSPLCYIPVSAFNGDNVAAKSERMPWYTGKTVLEAMDDFPSEPALSENVFRMPVQDIYKFTRDGDDRRIVAGTIESGNVKSGNRAVFYPSGKSSVIKTIERFPVGIIENSSAGDAAGFTLTEQIYVRRGEIMTIDGQDPPLVSSRIKANIFWLGKQPLEKNKKYSLKIGTEKTGAYIDEILSVLNSSDLSASAGEKIKCNEVAECIIETDKPIAFDIAEKLGATSRFVLVDDFDIKGGGIILSNVQEVEQDIREKVLLRNYKWEHSGLSAEHRAERYSQKPVLMVITGENNAGKKQLAKALERSLVENGRFAYYLGIGTFLYGVDSDIKSLNKEQLNHREHIRRFAEVANLMLDAGIILIVTARSLTASDISIIKMIVSGEVETVWVGGEITTDLTADLVVESKNVPVRENVYTLVELLKDKRYIFKF
ncbi:MAG: GTP-binding protein [Clostridiales bacterium]|jgi:bifunctional enzyme CysN/CysC|nr:GTP-binding protein [Clostridiales bacterium]